MTEREPIPGLPAHACDCHVHVFEDGFPLAATATFEPPPSPLSRYRAVQRRLGLQRAVIVQPTGYGMDNRCMLNAIAQLGVAQARGVAVADLRTESEAGLQRLHEGGIRGLRFMMLAGSGGLLPWDLLAATAARIAPLGWHIDLQLDGRNLPHHTDALAQLPCPLVIDHTGKFLEPVAPEHPAFVGLLRLLAQGNTWIKLSAPYETSRTGPPGYDDVSRLARALAQRFPERCLWASNWPHLNRDPLPDDAALLDLLGNWAGDERTRHAILVDNPARVYGFDAAAA